MELKAAFYPDMMLLADFQTQIDLGCDPEVLRLFPDEMIARARPMDQPIMIWSADEKWWKHEAPIKWLEQRRKIVKTAPDVH